MKEELGGKKFTSDEEVMDFISFLIFFNFREVQKFQVVTVAVKYFHIFCTIYIFLLLLFVVACKCLTRAAAMTIASVSLGYN